MENTKEQDKQLEDGELNIEIDLKEIIFCLEIYIPVTGKMSP